MSHRRTALVVQREDTPTASSSGNSTPGTPTEPDDTGSAVIESPIKRRKKKTKTLADKPDLEVWDVLDCEIIGKPLLLCPRYFLAYYLLFNSSIDCTMEIRGICTLRRHAST